VRRRVAALGAVLVLAGGAAFGWKVLRLGLPVVPSGTGQLWQISVEVRLTGGPGEPVSVSLAIPPSRPGQAVVDEEVQHGRLALEIERAGEQRRATWSGAVDGATSLHARFRIRSVGHEVAVPVGSVRAPRAGADDEWVDHPELAAALEEISLPPRTRAAERLRVVFAFVRREVAGTEVGADDPLNVLRARSGTSIGRERLLVALLRGAGLRARLVRGVDLSSHRAREVAWTEVEMAGARAPLSASEGFFGVLPATHVAWNLEGGPLLEVEGARSIEVRWSAIEEGLSADEIAVLSMPTHPTLASISLYRLSVPAQQALRILLLLPLGGLIVALFRNLVGIPSFGTFMPMLIALALRETGLGAGLLMVGVVLAVGVAARLGVQGLRLLLVPRLALLLCFVVLSITTLALLLHDSSNRDWFSGIVFPVVILTMLAERVALRVSEEGTLAALWLAATSTLLALVTYPFFRSETVEHLMFSFPELVLVVMGLLVWCGGYQGYRLVELWRFRDLEHEAEATP